MTDQIETEIIAETESLAVWVSQEPDGETSYHLELSSATIHFFEEEWQEFLLLISRVSKKEK
jgi:hypothetical protein